MHFQPGHKPCRRALLGYTFQSLERQREPNTNKSLAGHSPSARSRLPRGQCASRQCRSALKTHDARGFCTPWGRHAPTAAPTSRRARRHDVPAPTSTHDAEPRAAAEDAGGEGEIRGVGRLGPRHRLMATAMVDGGAAVTAAARWSQQYRPCRGHSHAVKAFDISTHI